MKKHRKRYDWAKNEAKLHTESECGCISGCGKIAFLLYKLLVKKDDDIFHINLILSLLTKLTKHIPITEIMDTDDVWEDRGEYEGKHSYQCKRMSSLFKTVNSDGTIKYEDTNRAMCKYLNEKYSCRNFLASDIVDKMYPLTMPYKPDICPYIVYADSIANGNSRYIKLSYLITPDLDKVDISKYYKDDNNENEFIEITEDEYNNYNK